MTRRQSDRNDIFHGSDHIIKRGAIHTVTEVIEANGGQLIRTDSAHLGILKGPRIEAGDALEIGNVCGNWCFVFVKGERVRANILESAAPDVSEEA